MSVIQPDPIRSPERRTFENEERLRQDVKRTFSRFQYVPEEWIAELIDRAQLDLFISSSQVFGLSNSRPQQSRVIEAHSTSSTTYEGLGGPSFSQLSSGVYILQFYCNFNSGSGGDGLVSVSVNGAEPSDDDAAEAQATGTETRFNLANTVTLELPEDSNTVEIKYRVRSGAGTYYRRSAIIQRVSNL